ncbi:Sterol-4-alpha-carboxylate 3-dehydrogenase, decarboxylating [Fusarium austroafricanum]|uniref:Sterol-4-alpha-carboxylate 3-dehydrogenase, decarboxylating n=1 Tax=Fusarium austroafricanum TaxID=2364996 RepID=A0A8H4JHF8_9HYPO|nr:Sterol-4-alpha-carboxylate 3-dehydrogenase, decarboxylating [Fusarium austroafricanum]
MSHTKQTLTPLIGSSLVVGGNGFLGFHLVRQILQDDECGDVHVLDVDVSKNRHEEASYFEGSITDAQLVRKTIADTRPTVIYHTASPTALLPAKREGEYWKTNVEGTEILLNAALESDAVKAFVFTSSVDVYANPPHADVDETFPLWKDSNKSNEYNRTKAIADILVRQANSPQLRTVSLRPGHGYGERHTQGLVEVLDMCKNKKIFQIGDGSNLMEVASGENCAIAHVLAAKALLDPTRAAGNVEGEAFNVSDGAPVPFWHHMGVIWKTARGEDVFKDVVILPAWVMISAVVLVEWFYWVFTFNTVKPPGELRRVSLHYCVYTNTFSIEKARKTLKFNPISNHDAVVSQSARWMLEYQESKKNM